MRRLLASMAVLVFLLLAASVSTAFADEGSCQDSTQVNVSFPGNTFLGTLVENYDWSGTLDAAEVISETWALTGQMNGQGVSATGTWQGKWENGNWIGTFGSIDTWNMGRLGAAITISGKGYGAGSAVSRPQPNSQASGLSGKPTASLRVWLRNLNSTYDLPVVITGRDKGKNLQPGLMPGPCSPADQGATAGRPSGLASPLLVPAGEKTVISRSFSLTNVAAGQPVTSLPRTGEAPAWYGLLAFGMAVLGAGSLLMARRLYHRAG